MVKPKKVLDTKLWDKFANDLEVQLAILKPGTKIAFFVGESDKNYLFINRVEGAVNHEFKVNGSLNMMDLDLFLKIHRQVPAESGIQAYARILIFSNDYLIFRGYAHNLFSNDYCQFSWAMPIIFFY